MNPTNPTPQPSDPLSPPPLDSQSPQPIPLDTTPIQQPTQQPQPMPVQEPQPPLQPLPQTQPLPPPPSPDAPFLPQPPLSPSEEPAIAPPTQGSVISPGSTTVSPQPLQTQPLPPQQAPIMPLEQPLPSQPVVSPTVSPNPQPVIGGVVSAPDSVPNIVSNPASAPQLPTTPDDGLKSRKKLVRSLIILAVVLLVSGITTTLLSLIGGTVKYSKADLVTAQATNYSVSYPKQWVDVSKDSKLLARLGAVDDGFSDTKAFAYHVNNTNNTYQSIAIFADQNDGISDADLTSSLQDPATRAKFSALAVPNFTANDVGCKSISNKKSGVNYNVAPYIVRVNFSVDCVPIPETGVSVETSHFEALLEVKNGFMFTIILETSLSDWNRNMSFFQNDLIPSLQAK